MPNDRDICVAFGEAVRARRVELGLSQEKFAIKAELDRTYISGVERGVRNVSLRNIAVIAKALEMPIPKLMESMTLESGTTS
jgi:transcriptional regulator with XRE-family HTH domain